MLYAPVMYILRQLTVLYEKIIEYVENRGTLSRTGIDENLQLSFTFYSFRFPESSDVSISEGDSA